MIQSTMGISRPRAATSVHKRVPDGALQNSKKVVVRFCCFCLPWQKDVSDDLVADIWGAHMKIEDRDIDIVQ
jgi:hypothetical protein